jgi:hypothetical protein
MGLEYVIFPTVALELTKPVYYSGGMVFANTGATVLARGRERGEYNEVTLTNPKTGRAIGCTIEDIRGARVLEAIPA